MIIDFYTIIDPLKLLEALSVFNPINGKLIVGEYNVCNIEIGSIFGGLGRLDFCDEKSLHYIDSAYGGFNPYLSNDNVPLAIRIFQHAVKENIVGIKKLKTDINFGTVSKYNENGFFNDSFYETICCTHFLGDRKIHFMPDLSYYCLKFDIYNSIISDNQLVCSNKDIIKISEKLSFENHLHLSTDGINKQVIKKWTPKNIREIYKIIEEPQLFSNLIEATQLVLEEKKYQNDLKIFLPKWVADFTTLGSVSLVEMLYKIFRHKKKGFHNKGSGKV